MIQRIQSIYLLLAAVLLGLTFVAPFAYLTAVNNPADEMWLYGYTSVDGVHSVCTWVNILLASLSIIVAVATIFLYKNRHLQIAMTQLVIVTILLLILACGVTLYLQLQVQDDCSFRVGLASLFPPLALVSTWLARRGILKDEKLVRDAEHFR